MSAQQREFLEAILRNGRHLLELINGILDLSKVEAGRMSLALAPTDLREAITGAVADTESLRRAKQQNVWLELDDTPLNVIADGVRVRQVLFNLLSNASKFTGEGGSIILSALGTRAPLAPPADRAGDERKLVTKDVVWVSVADTRYRHRVGGHAQAVPGVQPGGQLRQPAGAGHRSRPRAQQRSWWRCTAGPSARSRSRAAARPSGSSFRPTGRCEESQAT